MCVATLPLLEMHADWVTSTSSASICFTWKMQAELGNAYKLYLLENTESKPVVVVLPATVVQPVAPPVNEVSLLRRGGGILG